MAARAPMMIMSPRASRRTPRTKGSMATLAIAARRVCLSEREKGRESTRGRNRHRETRDRETVRQRETETETEQGRRGAWPRSRSLRVGCAVQGFLFRAFSFGVRLSVSVGHRFSDRSAHGGGTACSAKRGGFIARVTFDHSAESETAGSARPEQREMLGNEPECLHMNGSLHARDRCPVGLGFWVPGAGCRVSVCGRRVSCVGFLVPGFGCRGADGAACLAQSRSAESCGSMQGQETSETALASAHVAYPCPVPFVCAVLANETSRGVVGQGLYRSAQPQPRGHPSIVAGS